MIPINMINEWRQVSPWVYQSQVEQDLVLSRALVELYQNEIIRRTLAFRGGTALNKLFIKPASRYSEDLDFVQMNDEPIGFILSAIRSTLDPWLGEAQWKQGSRSAKLFYRFLSEDIPPVPLRLKIEINTTEFFTLYGYQEHLYSVESRWFRGKTSVKTFELEELMGTKLRALYQRLKGRDLFDLWFGITRLNMNCNRVVETFQQYNHANNRAISRAEFESNLIPKMENFDFIGDVRALLSDGNEWIPREAYNSVMDSLIAKLPGKCWKDNPVFKNESVILE